MRVHTCASVGSIYAQISVVKSVNSVIRGLVKVGYAATLHWSIQDKPSIRSDSTVAGSLYNFLSGGKDVIWSCNRSETSKVTVIFLGDTSGMPPRAIAHTCPSVINKSKNLTTSLPACVRDNWCSRVGLVTKYINTL